MGPIVIPNLTERLVKIVHFFFHTALPKGTMVSILPARGGVHV